MTHPKRRAAGARSPKRPGGPGAETVPLGAVGAAAALAMLLTLVPYACGAAWSPAGFEFNWTRRANNVDLPNYLAMIERVRAGELLVENAYSIAEPSHGAFRPAYLAIGLVARATGLPGIAAYHLGRIAFGTLLVVAVWRLAGRVLVGRRERVLALLLVCLGSGVSWVAALLGGPERAWPDAWQTEANVFAILLESPHFCFGLWLVLEFVLQLDAALGAADGAGARRRLALAGLALCLGLFEQPFNGPLCGLLAAALLASRWRAGVAPRRLAAGAATEALAAALPAVWLGTLTRIDPGLASWAEKIALPSPAPAAYLAAFAPLWVLGAVGLRHTWSSLGTWRLPLLVWSLAPAALVTLPVAFQRRLAEGWMVPLGLLAGAGVARLRVPPLGRPATAVALVALACAGSVHLVASDLRLYRGGTPRTYEPVPVMEALRFVASRARLDDVVLASQRFAAWVPAHAPVRVPHGHLVLGEPPPETRSALLAALSEAQRTGRPPRFDGPLARARFAVFVGRGPGGPTLALAGREVAPWGGPPDWSRPGVAVYELPSSGAAQ